MTVIFTNNARRFGIISGVGYTILSIIYVVTLIFGFLSLRTPDEPIGDPMFTILEVSIILIMCFGITLMSVVHAWASNQTKVFSLVAVVFMSLVAVITCSVHFVVLTMSQQEVISEIVWMPLFISFKWPSIGYALDILAWDVFFPLAVLFAVPVFSSNRLAKLIKVLLIVSGVLAFSGLIGVFANDMQVRNIGILGYAIVFPIAVGFMSMLFYRTAPQAP